jgi:FkbM family methyltransferase
MEERRPIEYILDVGAHVGLWSRPMMHRANTKYIWAFEPNQLVRECYVLNMGGFDNYSIYPFALGDKNRKGHLNVETDNSGNTNIHPTKNGDTEIRTLDSFNFEHIDYIKVDVEGFEYNFLKGAVDTLNRCRPFVHLEMKSKNMRNSKEEFTRFMKNIGYSQVLKVGAEVLYDYNT